MTTDWRTSESAIVEQLAARYRSQGYDVETGVRLEDACLEADLIARRSDETVLVEVKRPSRQAQSQDLKAHAEYAERHGWRFSIVLAVEQAPWYEIDVPSRERALALIADARAIDPSSWIAAIAAVAAFEAAARYRLARTGRRSMPRPSPQAHVQALAAGGLVTPAEEDVLRRLIVARNAAAHGVAADALPSRVVEQALGIATALVENESAAA